jgi:hypothetical protein
VPHAVIIKREKARSKGDGDEDDGHHFERTAIRIPDPLYPELGLRHFLWDSFTECYHDSLDTKRCLLSTERRRRVIFSLSLSLSTPRDVC